MLNQAPFYMEVGKSEKAYVPLVPSCCIINRL